MNVQFYPIIRADKGDNRNLFLQSSYGYNFDLSENKEIYTVITFSRRHNQNMLSRPYSVKLQRFPVNLAYTTSYKGFYSKKLLFGKRFPVEMYNEHRESNNI